MTATQNQTAPAPVDEVSLTIDGVEVSVPKGTLIIRAAEQVGIQIPRFCDHPLLKPAGACRQCLVEVASPDREGNVRTMPKPQASCTMEVSPGMVVSTQNTSPVADKAQHGNMEFLLINHPLDCPVCDKGGECPLQNQAMSNGRATSRFTDVKRTFPKPIKISTQIMLDRDRCILCQRCTRFSDEIAGDPFIDLQGRGGGNPGREVHGQPAQQIGAFDEGLLGFAPMGSTEPVADPVGTDEVGPDGAGAVLSGLSTTVGDAEVDTAGRPFASYFSGNTIQICPVGALTSASYRFRSRPFDLVSTESVAEHDACGAAIRIDHRRGVVMRRLAGEDPGVNEEWISDKDRFAFTWQSGPDRITTPLVRNEQTGELEPTSWSEAIHLAARGLREATESGGVGVIPGGRLTLEDGYAWSKLARVVLGTNDVDFRTRARSDEERDFLAAHVAGAGMDVTYADLERAGQVLLVGLEPEEEAATIFLRLRKGMLAGTVSVATLAPFATRGTTKMRGQVIPTAPGDEAAAMGSLGADHPDLLEALRQPGAVIAVGERLALSPGGYTAALALARETGAHLVWVPRRAGDRAAVEAGLLPNLLPGGRPAADAEARVDTASVWGVDSLPEAEGRCIGQMLRATAAGEMGGLLLGGFDLDDLPGTAAAEEAITSAGFVVQLETRRTAVGVYADVVLPVAPTSRKGGTFLTWEGRPRPFGPVFPGPERSDAAVLHMLAAAMGTDLHTDTLESIHRELGELAGWDGAHAAAPEVSADAAAGPAEASSGAAGGEHVLATWRMLLDSGSGQDGEPHLAGTAHRPVVRLSPAAAQSLGLGIDDRATVTGPAGSVTLPVIPTTMPDHVVWLPQHSPGSWVYRMVGAGAGEAVHVAAATSSETSQEETR